MWFKLTTADFSNNNLGKMSDLSNSISITYNSNGFTPSTYSVSKTAANASLVLNLKSGWTCTTPSVTISGAVANGSHTYSSGKLTIPIKPSSGTTFGASGVSNISIAVTGATSSSGGGTGTTKYTITYKYMSGSTSIKTATTEQVAAGTAKTFSTSNAPAITGYTVSSVSPTSATIDKDTIVTYYYTANVVGGDELEAGTYTYNNSGYILATTGKVTTGNTWIHSDFIPVNQLANGDDGKCVRTFTGHGTVAAIAFYRTKDNFDSWVSSVKTGEITGGATSVTAEYVKSLAPTGGNYVVFSTDGSKQTLSVTVGSSSGSSEPVEPEIPAGSGINYYEKAGFIGITSGQVTNTSSTWIHSDFIAIDSLVDDAELGHCIGKCTGHASVADIAFYSAANFDSFIIGKSSAGATKTVAELQALMTQLNATNATHIIISTDKTKNQLYASLK